MTETLQDFSTSMEGREISRILSTLSCEAVEEELARVHILSACAQARACRVDYAKRARQADKRLRNTLDNPKYEKTLQNLAQIISENPERFRQALQPVAAGLGLSVEPDDAVKIVVSVLLNLNEALNEDLRLEWSTFYRRQHFNLKFPKLIDGHSRGRKLPLKATCLAFEIELLLRYWDLGLLRSHYYLWFNRRLPRTERSFFEFSAQIASLALGEDLGAFIDARSLEQFARRNPNVEVAPWPVTTTKTLTPMVRSLLSNRKKFS